ncbi:uncharacterized protein BDR25DRAFT_253574 [Lindgomyces ingoldianus]|uniref:Uncharacterized protein n=1 Tax=Lindgomyces ingoldianus TaxID=673940 RepID=A0ACB6R9J9_9PLEO|nr:uncharacterized protein BDR25DRAFT_253574 [Lindgomyces ingoldianus]KAF2475929.1 hypothetical protein BDR25DRAFT_253574 [Lindgomyces ingoldianus]
MAPTDMSGMAGVNVTAMAMALTPEQIAETEWSIENTGRITAHDFKIAIGVLFGLAALTCTGRIFIRLFSRRRLYLDDAFLIFALTSLVGGTAILYKRIHMIYLEFSVLRQDPVASLLAFEQMDELFQQSKWQLAYLPFLWTAIFAVKWCYFAFFYPLLRAMARSIVYYYWLAIAFSVVSWLFLVIGEQLITCPHVGKAAAKCFPVLPASKSALLVLFWICPVLDALCDIMIVSIPILILRQSQMRLITKIGLGVFLCLSVFMIACSIIRASGLYYGNALDYPWQVFWLHAEACIGVIMGSITVYRSTLVGSNEVSDKLHSYFARIFGRGPSHHAHTPDSGENEKGVEWKRRLGIKIPGATLTGLRTMFGADKAKATTKSSSALSQDSDLDLIETDYHAHIKKSTSVSGPTSREAFSEGTCFKTMGHTSSIAAARSAHSEEPQHIGGVAGFLLRLALPAGHRVVLQHRSIGTGETEGRTH